MITLIEAERTFEKKSMSFQVDLKECGTGGVYFNITKATYGKSTTNILLNGQNTVNFY